MEGIEKVTTTKKMKKMTHRMASRISLEGECTTYQDEMTKREFNYFHRNSNFESTTKKSCIKDA